MPWIIQSKSGNSFGDLNVTLINTETDAKLESTFSEGEHYQLEHFLEALNKQESVNGEG